MIKFILLFFAASLAPSFASAVPSPEQQAQAFVFALHDEVDLDRALPNLLKDSASYLAHPERMHEVSTAIKRVLNEFGPIRFSRLLKKEDLAPVLLRLSIVSDTVKGPLFWGMTFYRKDPQVEDWTVVSIRVSGAAEDILR